MSAEFTSQMEENVRSLAEHHRADNKTSRDILFSMQQRLETADVRTFLAHFVVLAQRYEFSRHDEFFTMLEKLQEKLVPTQESVDFEDLLRMARRAESEIENAMDEAEQAARSISEAQDSLNSVVSEIENLTK